jgi:hypothetical protein
VAAFLERPPFEPAGPWRAEAAGEVPAGEVPAGEVPAAAPVARDPDGLPGDEARLARPGAGQGGTR